MSGTCDPKLDGDGKGTIAIVHGADGSWSMMYPGVPGACPASLDTSACRFTAQCEAKATDGSTVATDSLDLHFDGAGFHGSAAAGFRPPLATPGCQASYTETGTKL